MWNDTRPLVTEGAPEIQDSKFQTVTFRQEIISGRKSYKVTRCQDIQKRSSYWTTGKLHGDSTGPSIGTVLVRVVIWVKSNSASEICARQERRRMCEQIRTRARHWSMLRYWLLVFSLECKLENKLVVSLSCRLEIARDTKVSIKKNWLSDLQ
jgi:hypothetical protein